MPHTILDLGKRCLFIIVTLVEKKIANGQLQAYLIDLPSMLFLRVAESASKVSLFYVY